MSVSCFEGTRHKLSKIQKSWRLATVARQNVSKLSKDIFGKQRPGTSLMHLPLGDVRGPSGKTWQYNSHHVTTDLDAMFTKFSRGFFSGKNAALESEFSKDCCTCMSLEVSKKDLNWKFIPSTSRYFKWVLALRNYRNVRRIPAFTKPTFSHIFEPIPSLWHNPTACAACAWSAAFVGELEPPWLCNTWSLGTVKLDNAIRPRRFQAGTARQVRNHYASIAVCVCMNMYILIKLYHNTI